jgi:hypothetical protein
MKCRLTFAKSSVCLVLFSTLADAASDDSRHDTRGAWPSDRSKAPPTAAWRDAKPVSLPRVSGERASGCEIKVIAEWLRVRCDNFRVSAITELGGTRTDVNYVIEPPGVDRLPGAGELTFPVRPGERRVFLVWTLGPGYDGPLTVVPAVVVQSHWLAGDAGPSITCTDALHEPVATKTHPRAPVKDR